MRLFVSYTQQDMERVKPLVTHLRDAGHDFAAGGTMPLRDDEWQDQLRQIIRESDAFVYALTPNSIESEWCRWEYMIAIEEGIPLIPVMLESTALDMHLDDHPYADFTDGLDDERRVNAFLSNLERIMVTIPRDEVMVQPVPASKPARFEHDFPIVDEDLEENTSPLDMSDYLDDEAPLSDDNGARETGERKQAIPPPDPRLTAPAPDMKTHIAPKTFEHELRQRTNKRRRQMLLLGVGLGAFVVLAAALAIAAAVLVPIITFDPEGTFTEAQQAAAAGDFQEAVALYSRVIDDDPRNIEAYLARAEVYVRMEEFDNALADFNQVLRIDENNINAYNNRGNHYARQGDFLLALDDYNTALDLAPENSLLYFNRGNAFRQIGANRQAIANYNRVIQLSPDNPLAYTNRGIAFANLEEYDTAIDSFSRAIEIAPDLALVYALRGVAYQRTDQPEAAEADFIRHIELTGDNALPAAVEGLQAIQSAAE